MKIKVKFFSGFRSLFGTREKDLELSSGDSLRRLLDVLCDTPARRGGVFKDGGLQRQIIVMKNGAPLPSSTGLETRLEDGDIIALFPFISGG